VLIYGTGVQGPIYGAVLHERGHHVSFLARGERARELRSGGLTLQGVLGSRGMRIARPVVVESLDGFLHLEKSLARNVLDLFAGDALRGASGLRTVVLRHSGLIRARRGALRRRADVGHCGGTQVAQ